jgi:putative ubiquitin-RnfH superfamily antitoxin RatB of RatAB toxin-antitoxin module
MRFASGRRRCMVNVEIIYLAEDGAFFHEQQTLPVGATVGDALLQSKLYQEWPETQQLPLGVFARPVTLVTRLREGDRIEVYRPLTLDPKQKRRERAKNAGGKSRQRS